MNWLTRVRNVLPFVAKRETPDNLWLKCPACAQMIYTKEYEENLSVCPTCGHHGRIGPKARFAQLFDEGKYGVLPSPKAPDDPLKFRDTKRYADRIKAARAATGEQDALINARGHIHGHDAVIGVQDFAFMGGSMWGGVGDAFIAEAVKMTYGHLAATAARAPAINASPTPPPIDPPMNAKSCTPITASWP